MAMISNNIYDENVHKGTENYIFDNAVQLKDHEWLISITATELAKLWDTEQLVYYPNTQRGVVSKRGKNGKKVPTPISSKKNIKEIEHLILRDEYFPDMLTLNIISDETNVDYDKVNSKLKMKYGLLCILDGYHRLRAIYNIYNAKKTIGEDFDIDLNNIIFPAKITNYNRTMAAQQFAQYTKGLKINTSRAEAFNMNEAANRIVNELNYHSVLKGMINCTTNTILKDDEKHIVTFGTLVTAIRDSFGTIKNEETEKEYLNFLKEFFQELFKIFGEMADYKTRIESREYSLVCENFMFYVWVHLAKTMYLQKSFDWKKQMNCIEYIDYNKDSDVWSEITKPTKSGGYSIINNKSTRKRAQDIFMEEFFKCVNMGE